MTPAAHRGRLAEDVCADCLFARGYALIGRNVRVGSLEIDLIARRGPLAVLVEVRTRGAGSLVGPFASVTLEKQRRLLRAAERLWRSVLAGRGIERVRIDVAAVTFGPGGPYVEIMEGAVTRGFDFLLPGLQLRSDAPPLRWDMERGRGWS